MSTRKINSSPFTKCEKGHDLTLPDAHTYDNSGRRFCRQCATSNGKVRSPSKKKSVF